MTKKIITTLAAITCTSFLACSPTPPTSSSPSSASSPSSTITSSSDNQAPPSEDAIKSDAPTVDAKDFVDTFIGTQKCVVDKLSTLSSSDAPQKPSAEEIAKITKAIEEKSQNSANKEAAWNELGKGCNNSEIAGIHNFFQCQRDACDEPTLAAANEKHKTCTIPDAGDGCKKSFEQFMNYFSPF